MTVNRPDDSNDEVSPWSAQAARAESGARTPDGEQGPVRPESGPQASGEQGPATPGAGNSGPPSGETWTPGGQWAAGERDSSQQVLYGSAVGGHAGYPHQPVGPPYRSQPPLVAERKGSRGMVAGVTLLALLVGGAAGAAGGYLVADSRPDTPTITALDTPPTAKQTAAAPAGSVEAVAQKVLPSVVQLQVEGRAAAGEGSGFVISADGLIVTNNHVVEAAARGGQITAVFQDGRTAPATIVGRDPTSDIAVVQATGVNGLAVAEIGRSDDLRVGQGVVAIGSPYELSGTVTSGIVSSLRRPTRAGGENGSQATVMDAIQTDAAINPGNSGGPLVNMQGQVIGINSAIYTPRNSAGGGSVGIGFAIPVDQARRTAEEIVKTGKATQTVLGVSVKDNPDGGAFIAEVVPGGAGEKAGIKPGEVVTQMDDRRIDTSDALVAAVRSKAPGDKVKLVIGNGARTVEATLGGQPVETE
ncbi:S1C family serine protease [Actinokineospora iranica]|uniref:Putative serine protease PepD n=1 Tax=Actinokineospora iranica TaxID=1271860 RepID=A0A1G6TNG2_9PSEU|nr:trypsin-like peptidase domain-containing protein [Actinokineospora iranica]SDD30600.1 putative serine protease PepD [Actinokineospora iranica]